MKIAIASEENMVSGHFGHCEGFTLYDVENKKAGKKEFVANPGHRPGYLPVFLRDLQVKAIIAGGMGETAQDLFHDNGIEVFVGIQGSCDDVADEYARGALKSTDSICSKHEYEGHCNE